MPPRNPLGILKTLIVKRIRNILSDQELYRYRASVERVVSRLKQHLSLENHKVRRLKNIAIHILLCITTILLIALATFKQNKPEKIRSPLTTWKINT